MTHVAFATYEFSPVNPGGAGVLIAGAARLLARDGVDCTVVCGFPEREIAKARQLLAQEGLSPGRVELISVERLNRGQAMGSDGQCIYEARSSAFASALKQLHRDKPIDLIEFPEYAGVALATLAMKVGYGAFSSARIAIRVHGGLEFIDWAEGRTDLDPDRIQMYRMERLALRLADHVLVPSRSLGEWYQEAYGFPIHSMLLSVPPVKNLTWGFRRNQHLVDPGHFLFYGRLQEVKGCDLFAQAAVSVLGELPERSWRFTFVGSDAPCIRHQRPNSECLKQIIPTRMRHAFEFLSAIDRTQLAEVATGPVAAVVPSRFESFCLAAHELRVLGLPLIVSDIAGFRDYFSEKTGALVFDRTAAGLGAAMLRMRDEPGLADRLAAQPLPAYGSFTAPYHDLIHKRLTEPSRLLTEREILWRQLVPFQLSLA